jgi:hypothetical protein
MEDEEQKRMVRSRGKRNKNRERKDGEGGRRLK